MVNGNRRTHNTVVQNLHNCKCETVTKTLQRKLGALSCTQETRNSLPEWARKQSKVSRIIEKIEVFKRCYVNQKSKLSFDKNMALIPAFHLYVAKYNHHRGHFTKNCIYFGPHLWSWQKLEGLIPAEERLQASFRRADMHLISTAISS